MTSIAVKDLKKPRELRDTLEREHEVMVTKDGRPFAIMVEVDADGAEETLREVRRALLSSAVMRARSKASGKSISPTDVESEINAVRKARKS